VKPLHVLKPKVGKEIPFLILISFLLTFAGSRLITYFFPSLFLNVKNTHIHHFSYGIILLSILGFYLLTQPRSDKTRLKASVFYGFALGLAFDEFAMWIQLEDVYRDRSTYDAIMVITLFLLNAIYFEDFWKKWGHHLKSLFKKIFYP
jgi:glucan phosphoethanolaminetransferase (alkaline phosphatase superfamily)